MIIDGETLESEQVDIEVYGRKGEIDENNSAHNKGHEEVNTRVQRHNITNDAAQEATGKARPIMNLICVVRSQWAAAAISELKDRLRPESAVLAIQDGLGVLEEIFELNYPDTRTRPSFRLGLMTHRMWAERLDVGDDENVSENSKLEEWGIHPRWSRATYLGKGQMFIGPLAIKSLTTSRSEEAKGVRNTQYLLDQMLACAG